MCKTWNVNILCNCLFPCVYLTWDKVQSISSRSRIASWFWEGEGERREEIWKGCDEAEKKRIIWNCYWISQTVFTVCRWLSTTSISLHFGHVLLTFKPFSGWKWNLMLRSQVFLCSRHKLHHISFRKTNASRFTMSHENQSLLASTTCINIM